MTAFEPSGRSAPSRAHQYEKSRSGLSSTLTDVCSIVARALAEAPVDLDDESLLAILGRSVVPTLGDVVAVYRADASGNPRLVAAAPADAPPARRLREHAARHPTALAGGGKVVDRAWASISSPDGKDVPGLAAGEPTPGDTLARWHREAAGIVSEIVAPLESAGQQAGLLVIGSVDPGRQYHDPDRAALDVLAALVSARYAAREQAVRAEDLRRRLHDMTLAGRELAHLLNNDLTMPVGVIELLLDRGTVTPDLQEMLEAAAKDLAALEQHIRAFHSLMRERST